MTAEKNASELLAELNAATAELLDAERAESRARSDTTSARNRLRAALERIAHGGVTDCMIAQDIAANAIDGSSSETLSAQSSGTAEAGHLQEALAILAIALPGPRPWPTEGVESKLQTYRNMALDRRYQETSDGH